MADIRGFGDQLHHDLTPTTPEEDAGLAMRFLDLRDSGWEPTKVGFPYADRWEIPIDSETTVVCAALAGLRYPKVRVELRESIGPPISGNGFVSAEIVKFMNRDPLRRKPDYRSKVLPPSLHFITSAGERQLHVPDLTGLLQGYMGLGSGQGEQWIAQAEATLDPRPVRELNHWQLNLLNSYLDTVLGSE